MKNSTAIIVILIIVLLTSCSKEEVRGPKVLWSKDYPIELQEFCCQSIHSRLNSPFFLESNEILFFGRSHENNQSKIFKINPNNFEQLKLWNEEIDWSIADASLFLDDNQLCFDARNESIYRVDLNELKTLNVFSAASSKDGMQKIDSFAFVLRNTSGISTIQINLNDGSERHVYTSNPYESGLFALNPIPFVYKSNIEHYKLVTCEGSDSMPILTKYDITNAEIEWQMNLSEFNDGNLPTTSEVAGNRIVINSKTAVSVRDLVSGELIWTKEKFIISNQEIPFVTDKKVIVPEENRISCFDLSDGKRDWIIQDKANGIGWGSTISFKKVQNYLFIDHNPIDINSGRMYWESLDDWGEQDYEYLRGNPAVDILNKCLYYTGSHQIYKVELPI